MGVVSGSRPDLTVAQMVALLVAGIPIVSNLLAAFGVFSPSEVQQDALRDAVEWGGLVGAALIGGDVLLRGARNRHDAKTAVAALTQQTRNAVASPIVTPGGIVSRVGGGIEVTGERGPTITFGERHAGETPGQTRERFAAQAPELPDDDEELSDPEPGPDPEAGGQIVPDDPDPA